MQSQEFEVESKDRLSTIIFAVLKTKPKSTQEFIDRLIDSDVIPFPYFKDNEMAGFSMGIVNDKGEKKSFGAKLISQSLSWGKLKKKINYKPDQDNELLLELAKKISGNKPIKRQASLPLLDIVPELDVTHAKTDSQEEGSPADEWVQPFEFSHLPSKDLLLTAFKKYTQAVESGDRTSSQLFLDQGATGTGKSYALASGTAEYLKSAIGRKNIICVVPEKRHGAAIKEDIEQQLGAKQIRVIPKNSEAMVEYGIPEKCPLRSDELYRMSPKIKAIESLVEDVKKEYERGVNMQKSTVDALLDRVERDMREIRLGCFGWIKSAANSKPEDTKSNCVTCKGCTTMFPGAALFSNKEPSIAVLTYHKLFSGLRSFEIKRGRARFFTYSPFVREAGGGKSPFKKCIFLMEEYSQGHMKIVSKIEEDALRLSLTETAKMVTRHFESAVDSVCGRIHKEDASVFQRFRGEIEEVRQRVLEKRAKFYLHDKSYKPFEHGDAKFNLFPNEGDTLNKAIASMSPVYSSIFPKDQIGLKRDDVTDVGFSNEIALFTVKKFDQTWMMRKEEFSSISSASLMMQEMIIEPVTWMAAEFIRITQCLPDSNMDWSLIFLEEVTGKNRDMVEFLVALMQSRESTKHVALSEVSGVSVLNDFYICGYDYIEARKIDGDNIVDIYVRIARPSPEAMIDCLLEDANKNTVYISSASCTIKSAITNFNLEWLESRHIGKIQTLSSVEGHAVLAEKSRDKVSPNVIWGGEKVTSPLLNLNLNPVKKSKSIPFIKAVLEKFAASLVGDGEKSCRSRVGILFANSKEDVKAIMASFRELAKERLDGKIFDEVEFHEVAAEAFAKGATEEIRRSAAEQLLRKSGTRLTLIFTTYGSMTTGANLTLKFDGIPTKESNFWSYVGHRGVRRHAASSGVEVDISDIVIAEKISNLVNENNYIREGHHIAAMGDLDWGYLSRNALAYNPDGPAIAMSSAIGKTTYLSAAMFDLVMQSIGRMDRTLNSSAEPNVFISSQLAKTFRDADVEIIGKTIIPPAITTAIKTAREQIEESDICDREDHIESIEMSSSELFTHFAKNIRLSPQIRDIWEKARDAFTSSTNELENLVIPVYDGHDFLHAEITPYLYLNKVKDLDYSLREMGLGIESIMFEVPEKFIEITTGTAQVAFEEKGLQVRFYEPQKINSKLAMNLPASYCRQTESLKIKSFFVIKPAILKEVVFPAKYEKEVRHIAERLCGKRVLKDDEVGNHLIERSDLFLPDSDCCIDAKAWSIDTMSASADSASMESLVKDARTKLRLMRDDAPNGQWTPSRYIYGFRRWFNRFVNSGNGSGAIFVKSGTDSELTNVYGDWDVAFLSIHGHHILHRALNAMGEKSAEEKIEIQSI